MAKEFKEEPDGRDNPLFPPRNCLWEDQIPADYGLPELSYFPFTDKEVYWRMCCDGRQIACNNRVANQLMRGF